MTIKKTIAAVLLLLQIFCAGLFAQSGSDYFYEQGNNAYRSNDYEKALEWYTKILDTGYSGSAVLYNIGNCYFKLDEIGSAVLYYEKALRLDPSDAEIQFNLDLANSRVIDRIQQPPRLFFYRWWDSLAKAFSLAQLTWLTAILYILTIIALVGWLLYREKLPERLTAYALAALAVMTFFSTILLISTANRLNNQRDAIVLTPKVNILSAPGEQGSEVFLLHEGVKVWRTEQRGDWVRIELPDGKSGWMRARSLGIIAN